MLKVVCGETSSVLQKALQKALENEVLFQEDGDNVDRVIADGAFWDSAVSLRKRYPHLPFILFVREEGGHLPFSLPEGTGEVKILKKPFQTEALRALLWEDSQEASLLESTTHKWIRAEVRAYCKENFLALAKDVLREELFKLAREQIEKEGSL